MGLIGELEPRCIISGGKKTASTIQSKLISVEVVDAAGIESDTVRIEIDAKGLDIWPATGQVIGVAMGYAETGVGDLGKFKLSRISESLLPNTLTLTGTAAPFEADDPTEFKKRRSATYEAVTVLDVVTLIAKRHGFSPRVHPDLAGVVLDHWDQNNETDISFLSRLARSMDAVCKPVRGWLVYSRRGQLKSLSGRILEPVSIVYSGDKFPADSDFTNASIVGGDRNRFSGILALWYSDDTGEATEIEIGEAPRKRLRTKYVSEAEAQRAAEAEYRKLQREGDKLSLQCPGNPLLAAEGLQDLSNFPSQRINGRWSADRVVHNYRPNGYRCSVEASVPGGYSE